MLVLFIYDAGFILGEKERLVDPAEAISGAAPRLIDDLDEDREGNIYWSDASALVTLEEGLIEGLAGGSGRWR